jgi:hypothetical protein
MGEEHRCVASPHPMNTSYASVWALDGAEVFADVDVCHVALPSQDDARWTAVEEAAGGPPGGIPVGSVWRRQDGSKIACIYSHAATAVMVPFSEPDHRYTYSHSSAQHWTRMEGDAAADLVRKHQDAYEEALAACDAVAATAAQRRRQRPETRPQPTVAELGRRQSRGEDISRPT